MKIFLTILILVAVIYGLQTAEIRKKKKQNCKKVTENCAKHSECCFRDNSEGGCSAETCKKQASQQCTKDAECVSGKCQDGRCGTNEGGQYCTDSFQCTPPSNCRFFGHLGGYCT